MNELCTALTVGEKCRKSSAVALNPAPGPASERTQIPEIRKSSAAMIAGRSAEASANHRPELAGCNASELGSDHQIVLPFYSDRWRKLCIDRERAGPAVASGTTTRVASGSSRSDWMSRRKGNRARVAAFLFRYTENCASEAA